MVKLCSKLECNYRKIINGIYCPKCGSKTDEYGFGRNWVQEKKKYNKYHEELVKSSENGYLICDECNTIYELQPGEKVEDFEPICNCGEKYDYIVAIDLSNLKTEFENKLQDTSTIKYLLCDECDSFYKLKMGEFPEDFSDECECGGRIEYAIENDLNYEISKNDLSYCPECGTAKPIGNFCIMCGTSLVGKESKSDGYYYTYFFIEGSFMDAKISKESIIIYKKSKLTQLRTSETREYPMNKIEKIKLSKSMNGFNLKFKYEGEYQNIDVPPNKINPSVEKVEKFFKRLSIPISKFEIFGICRNTSCFNMNSMEIGSKCPDCGSLVTTEGMSKIKKEKKYIHNEINKEEKHRQKEKKSHERIQQEYSKHEKDLRKLEDKKIKYGFLKAAKGIEGRLELYDYRIRLPGKQDYLIEDIISIDFKEANRGFLNPFGYIKFNIRGMNSKPPGGILTYGPNTGVNIGLIGRPDPETKIKFTKEWEGEFRELKNIIEAKMRESRGIVSNENKIGSNENKTDLNDLEKLAELRDKGIITEKEFQTKKKQILGL